MRLNIPCTAVSQATEVYWLFSYLTLKEQRGARPAGTALQQGLLSHKYRQCEFRTLGTWPPAWLPHSRLQQAHSVSLSSSSNAVW